MSQEETMRLIAEVKDDASGKLKEIQKSLKAASAESKKAAAEGTKNAREQAKAYHEMHELIGKVKERISGALTPAMATLGITAYGVGEALGKVTELLQKAGENYNIFNDAARRSGTSVSYVNAMTVAFERFGVAPDRARASIADMGEHLARISRNAPQEMNKLTGTFGNMVPAIRQALDGTKTVEERITRLTKFFDEHQEIPVDKRRSFFEAIGAPTELAQQSPKQIEEGLKAGADYIAKHPPDMDLLERLDKSFTHLRESLNGFGDDMVKVFGPAGSKIVDGFAKSIADLDCQFRLNKGFADERSIFGRMSRGILGKDDKTPQDRINEGFADTKKTEDAIAKGTSKGVLDAFREYLGNRDGGGSGGGSFKNMAFHPDGDGGGGGGGRGWGGGGYKNLGDSLGLGDGTGGAGSTGNGGSRGNRNNNRGNMKFGLLAKAFGATHADEKGFAVFPDQSSGDAAHEALLKSNAYKGLTLNQFGNKYSEGSASWKKTVGSELGIGNNDIVNNNDPRLAGAIRKAEGTNGGRSGGGVDGVEVPTSVLDKAENLLKNGGSTGQLQQFMASQGYPKAGNWCGEFAASVVKSAGGTPPKGAAVATSWLNYGQHVDAADAKAGDIAVLILRCLDRVSDLDQLAGGFFRVGVGPVSSKFHQAISTRFYFSTRFSLPPGFGFVLPASMACSTVTT
jgi:hypothetical protein